MIETEVFSNLQKGIFTNDVLTSALSFTGENQKQLFSIAREKRFAAFPDNYAQVRSVIEISNVCRQNCRYCAIGGKSQERNYTLKTDVIFALIKYLYDNGRRVILLQSGENVSESFLADTEAAVAQSKERYPDLRIILCMGNLTYTQYERLYKAGASDYILKFETSNESIFKYCKPNDTLKNRLECINALHQIGFRVGSGNIVGLPGQTFNDLAEDLILTKELPLSMNSTTIFIPAENSAFANEPAGNPVYTLNMMALMRIMNPQRLMPTTSSLEKMIKDGQYLGLQAGANTVTIHDGTPDELQKYFPIYSAKRVRPQKSHFNEILSRAGFFTDNLNS